MSKPINISPSAAREVLRLIAHGREQLGTMPSFNDLELKGCTLSFVEGWLEGVVEDDDRAKAARKAARRVG